MVRKALICVRLIPPYTLKHMTQFCPIGIKKASEIASEGKKKMLALMRKLQEKIK